MIITNLKELRKSKHISQKKLAEMIGKTPGFISFVESGRSGVSEGTARDLCNALDISMGELTSTDEVCGDKDKVRGLLKLNDLLSSASPRTLENIKNMTEIASQYKVSNDEITTIIKHLLGGIYD